MLLKRLYDHSTSPPRVIGVTVLHAGPRQRFSTHLIDQAIADGWMKLTGDQLVIVAQPNTLVYRVIHMPGYYCCYCQDALPGPIEAREHVATKHVESPASPSWLRKLISGGKPTVPDPANPAGYRRDNFYECTLESR